KEKKEGEIAAAPEINEEKKEGGGYFEFMDRELEKIIAMDLYGSSAMLPKGYFSIKYQFTHLNASKRFDGQGNKVPAIPPIEFSDGAKKFLSVDLGLTGEGGSHLVQLSYGITDPLDWYIEIPFQYMTVKMDPKLNAVDDDGNYIDPVLLAPLFKVKDPKSFTAADFLCLLPKTIGRPTPNTYYDADWVLGDIHTGFSWNYLRTKRFSAALTPRIYFPTGRIANPDSSLFYFTGPQLDVGTGSWGISATQTYDFRVINPFNWLDVIYTMEFTTNYHFSHKRKYPKNFETPNPEAMKLLDPTGSYFPDLSHLEEKGTFTYTPGFSADVTAKLDISFGIAGISAGYGYAFAQEPLINGDPSFITMVKGLQLLGQMSIHSIEIGGLVSLLPLYVPANLSFSWTKVIAGTNALIYEDYIKFTIQGYIPFLL
ncbi:MAG: hypothetical protein FJ088_13425, partial [Deltaproteobacteria bacterium]|nr:hypothetical protein [Deltaproteobacteria bacterium]